MLILHVCVTEGFWFFLVSDQIAAIKTRQDGKQLAAVGMRAQCLFSRSSISILQILANKSLSLTVVQ